jgi:DNA-binding transcriptional ArsR family regulator
MVDVFAAVADPTRREILERLRADGPQSVAQLSRPLPMSRQAVTKHLDLLTKAGLIEQEWRGRERFHRLHAQPLRRVEDWLAPYAADWDRRLARLEEHLDMEVHDDDED